MPSLRAAAPITLRAVRHGLPSEVPATLLGFGLDSEGVSRVFDTASRAADHVHLTGGYSKHDYKQWETGPFFGPAERIGDRLVFGVGPRNGAANGLLESIPADYNSGDNRTIATRGGDHFPSADGRAVWTFFKFDHGRRTSGVELDPDSGQVLSRSAPFPASSEPIAELSDGNILTEAYVQHHGDDVSVLKEVSPSSGDAVRVISRHASFDTPLLAAVGDIVAWQSPPECSSSCRIHISDVSTGTTRTVHWHPPYRFVCDDAALSPDARWLAVVFSCARPDDDRRDVILLISTASGRAHLVPGSAQQPDATAPVWSATGDWLFWEQRPAKKRCQIRAYQPGRRRADAFHAPCHWSDLLEAHPAS